RDLTFGMPLDSQGNFLAVGLGAEHGSGRVHIPSPESLLGPAGNSRGGERHRQSAEGHALLLLLRESDPVVSACASAPSFAAPVPAASGGGSRSWLPEVRTQVFHLPACGSTCACTTAGRLAVARMTRASGNRWSFIVDLRFCCSHADRLSLPII